MSIPLQILGVVLALPVLLCAETARADHYAGPPDAWTAYWTEPAFSDAPPKGPQAATGMIFWSHGVQGRNPQYHQHPPAVIRRLARVGWDVIKVQRNNLFESGWTSVGAKHVADLSHRVDEARAQGYRAVVAAGQSYGGAISIETAAINRGIDAVLAFSPGHGSDARGEGAGRLYENLTQRLIEALGRMQTGRAVVLVAEGDDLHPREVRGPQVGAALAQLGIPYLLFDERMPIKGHGAGGLLQFDVWYGACLVGFLDPAKRPRVGEHPCPAPSPLPLFLYPADLAVKPPAPGLASTLAELSGKWSGRFPDESERGREVQVVVEEIDATRARFVYTTGAGWNSDLAMGFVRREARVEGTRLVSSLANRPTIELSPGPGSGLATLVYTTASGRVFKTTLKRGETP